MTGVPPSNNLQGGTNTSHHAANLLAPPSEQKQQEEEPHWGAAANNNHSDLGALSAQHLAASAGGTGLPIRHWLALQHMQQQQQQQQQQALLQAYLGGGNTSNSGAATNHNHALHQLLMRQTNASTASSAYSGSAAQLLLREQETARLLGLQQQLQQQQRLQSAILQDQQQRQSQSTSTDGNTNNDPTNVLRLHQQLLQQQEQQQHQQQQQLTQAMLLGRFPGAAPSAVLPPASYLASLNPLTSGFSASSLARGASTASAISGVASDPRSSPPSRAGMPSDVATTTNQDETHKKPPTGQKAKGGAAKAAATKAKHGKPVKKRRISRESSASSSAHPLVASAYAKDPVRPVPPDIPRDDNTTTTPLLPHDQRTVIPLSTEEDPNWLSEFQCFLRAHILEIGRATSDDVKVRNNSKRLVAQQVGLRCRYCAHLPTQARARRSSAFPSSLAQVYQSVTMMVRDHLPACPVLPPETQRQLQALQTASRQGASDSKHYWVHAAKAIGLVDHRVLMSGGGGPEGGGTNVEEASGLEITQESREAAARLLPFGASASDGAAATEITNEEEPPYLIHPSDLEELTTMTGNDEVDAVTSTSGNNASLQYWFTLLRQVQTVHLTSAERVGNRKSLPVGLPGMACRYCCKAGRWGMSRVFPARRRTLPSKLPDLYDHLRRCTACPPNVRDELQRLHQQVEEQQQQQQQQSSSNPSSSNKNVTEETTSMVQEREFFSRIWSRLGHGDRGEPIALPWSP